MERTLCVWFPEWALRLAGSPPDRPLQAVGDDNRVVAANAVARDDGVRLGMQRREAEAVCPNVVTIRRDPGAEAVEFEAVVSAMEEVVPRVEVAEPGLAFLPVAGAVRYYGGERPLVERIAKEIEAVAGHEGRLGLAAGPFAARMAAAAAAPGEPLLVADDAAFLASRDVSTVAADDLVAIFRWLGITTLGELARLPRAAVLSRFGPAGLSAHRVASGEDRAVAPRAFPDDISVEECFDPPLGVLEQADFAARAMAARLVEAMAPTGTMPHRIEVEGEAADGQVRSRIWRSADPLGELALAERMRWQLRAWVEGYGIGGGLVRLRLTPADLSDRGRQLTLGDDVAGAIEAERSFLRAQGIAGDDAVLQARPQGGRDPGQQVLWHRWGEEAPAPRCDPSAPWPGAVPGPTPALVPPEPPTLDVEWDGPNPSRVRLGSRWEPVISWAGPWRRMGRWWDGEAHADRYQLVTSAGAFLVEVQGERALLAGIYD